MSETIDEIEILRKELNNKSIELENNNKLMSKVLRERDVSIKFNNELRNQLELLSAKLHLHQNLVKTISHSVETQTDISLINEQNIAIDQMVCSNCSKSLSNQTIESNSWKQNCETNNRRISELVRETAQEVVLKNSCHNDYYYDQKSKTYYSRSSGWYFYPERNIFYDPHTKNYYKYDSEKKVYNYYSSLQQNTDNKREKTTKSSKSKKSKKESHKEQEENEDFIDIPNVCSDVETIDVSSEEEGEIETSDNSDSLSETNDNDVIIEESPELVAPLVRMIVKESTTLEIGSLLLVTCMGAKIGNDSKCDVWITDESVSRIHAEIRFDYNENNYIIKDLNSTNGTFSNGIKLETDSEIALKHYDEISFGECLLLVHIHNGKDVTCDECEPGLVIANLKANQQSNYVPNEHNDREKERKENLKLLKKKYGLKNIDFCEMKVMTPSNYKDRSTQRRQEKGSDNPYEKTAAGTSIDTALSNSNKGYKMLQKMGWTSGEALGKQHNGNTQPILLEMRETRSGLGYQQTSDDTSLSAHNYKPELKLNKKCDKWKKAQQRFDQI